jgi:hypothetical protein
VTDLATELQKLSTAVAAALNTIEDDGAEFVAKADFNAISARVATLEQNLNNHKTAVASAVTAVAKAVEPPVVSVVESFVSSLTNPTIKAAVAKVLADVSAHANPPQAAAAPVAPSSPTSEASAPASPAPSTPSSITE